MNAAGVVIANPGSSPEIREMATAFGEASLLRRYVLPINASARHEAMARGLPGPVGAKVADRLRRRRTPRGVEEQRVRMRGTASELMFLAARRRPISRSWQTRLVHRRNVIF